MGFKKNADGVITYVKEEGDALISPELLEKLGDFASDTGGTLAKAGAAGVVAAGVGTAVAGSAPTALGVAGTAALTVAATESMKQEAEKHESTTVEQATGGMPYEKMMEHANGSGTNSTQAFANSFQSDAQRIAQQALQQQQSQERTLDPYEMARMKLQEAGVASFENTNDINSSQTSCLPQGQSRSSWTKGVV